MNITFCADEDNGRILAVYVSLSKNKVHKTVTIAEGECYADEDRKGNLLGVEMLVPGELELHIKKVAKQYHVPQMNKTVKQLRKVFT